MNLMYCFTFCLLYAYQDFVDAIGTDNVHYLHMISRILQDLLIISMDCQDNF